MKFHATLALTFTTVGLFSCVGCQSFTSSTATPGTTNPGPADRPVAHRGPEVEVVRSGVLARYDSTTVGKAFEGTFQNPTWSSFETPKGATVVQFDGTAMPDALKKANFRWDAYYDAPAVKQTCVASLGLAEALEQGRQEATKSAEEYRLKLAEIRSRMPRRDGTAEMELAHFRAYRSGPDPGGAHQAALEKKIDQQNANEAAARSRLTEEEIKPLEAVRRHQEEAEQQSFRNVEKRIDDCVESTPIPPVPVRFQFLLSADKKTFEINYVDQKVFGNRDGREVLDFIYR